MYIVQIKKLKKPFMPSNKISKLSNDTGGQYVSTYANFILLIQITYTWFPKTMVITA